MDTFVHTRYDKKCTFDLFILSKSIHRIASSSIFQYFQQYSSPSFFVAANTQTSFLSIKCQNCPEGATTFYRADYGYVVILSVAVFYSLFIFFREEFRNSAANRKKLEERILNKQHEALLQKKMRKRFKRLRPMLMDMKNRIDLPWDEMQNAKCWILKNCMLLCDYFTKEKSAKRICLSYEP